MPPKSKLAPQAIADLTKWVQMGLPWPETLRYQAQASVRGRAVGFRERGIGPFSRSEILHLRRSKRKPGPGRRLIGSSWRGSKRKGLVAFAASRSADLDPPRRRLTLTGLPPTPEEVDAFEADTAPDAFERLVDRLLASPRYGERWGRYWLDVARYADTKGYILFQDANYHWAYTYRDYVIHAFNRDLPYDRFLIEQIAADRLPAEDGNKPLTALGFLTSGRPVHGQCPRRHRRSDRRRLPRADEPDGHLRPLSRPQVRSRFPRRTTTRSTACWPVLASLISCRKPTSRLTQPPMRSLSRSSKSRQRKLSEFVAGKHREMVEASKRRAAEYLLAAQKALDQPSTEDFMLLADGNDLNPTMLVRWQVYLSADAQDARSGFCPLACTGGLAGARLRARCGPGDRQSQPRAATLEAPISCGRSIRSSFEHFPRDGRAR